VDKGWARILVRFVIRWFVLVFILLDIILRLISCTRWTSVNWNDFSFSCNLMDCTVKNYGTTWYGFSMPSHFYGACYWIVLHHDDSATIMYKTSRFWPLVTWRRLWHKQWPKSLALSPELFTTGPVLSPCWGRQPYSTVDFIPPSQGLICLKIAHKELLRVSASVKKPPCREDWILRSTIVFFLGPTKPLL
jgi:hypothetical protein